jgi:hypothetical protein
VIIAETGGDMSRFPTAGHLASWAGLAPALHESAGRRNPVGTGHGNRWLYPPRDGGHRWSSTTLRSNRPIVPSTRRKQGARASNPPALHGIAGRLGVHRHPGRLEVVTVAMPDGHSSKRSKAAQTL